MMGLRLAFCCGQWQPSMEQFVIAMSMIQPEERKKVSDYLFKRDVKTTLAGRLLIRKAIRCALHLSNKDIKLQRTDNGRPYMEQNTTKDIFDFNISHQDELVVLAGEFNGRVGIDTMAVDRPVGSKSVDKFFETMKRQFRTNEWAFIQSATNDKCKLFNFFRLWCMKESYVKAVGDGIGFSLSRIECCVDNAKMPNQVVFTSTGNNENIKFEQERLDEVFDYSCIGRDDKGKNCNIESTEIQNNNNNNNNGGGDKETPSTLLSLSSYVKVDGIKVDGCTFEEYFLMDRYLVSVAKFSNGTTKTNTNTSSFKFLNIEDLLECGEIKESDVVTNSLEQETFKEIIIKYKGDWTHYQNKEINNPNK